MGTSCVNLPVRGAVLRWADRPVAQLAWRWMRRSAGNEIWDTICIHILGEKMFVWDVLLSFMLIVANFLSLAHPPASDVLWMFAHLVARRL